MFWVIFSVARCTVGPWDNSQTGIYRVFRLGLRLRNLPKPARFWKFFIRRTQGNCCPIFQKCQKCTPGYWRRFPGFLCSPFLFSLFSPSSPSFPPLFPFPSVAGSAPGIFWQSWEIKHSESIDKYWKTLTWEYKPPETYTLASKIWLEVEPTQEGSQSTSPLRTQIYFSTTFEKLDFLVMIVKLIKDFIKIRERHALLKCFK